MTDVKIAAAPISWGVCEVPGWGCQLEPERVLSEMQELGFDATEFGPEGFLPTDPETRAEVLRQYGMCSAGGFVPAVIHDPEVDPLPQIEAELRAFVAAGADTLVLAAATGVDGYDSVRPTLETAGWQTVCGNIDRIVARAAADGITVALHPHVGTMVESQDDLGRVLDGSEVNICFDTGHMFIGGIDPIAFVKEHPDRISHVHLKDVSVSHAHRVRAGDTTYYEAVVDGMYRPLGQGDIDIRTIVTTLVGAGYVGWFTLEQDTVVAAEPDVGEGPVVQARESLDYLRSIVGEER